MTASNGRAPTAHQRTRAAAKDVAKQENALAALIGQAVALHLGQLLRPVFASLGQPACAPCATMRKIAEAAHASAVDAVLHEHEVAVTNAMAAAEDPPPDPVLPEAPELPAVQQGFTWVPIVVAPGQPPQVLPVCYDHLPASAQQAGMPAVQREVGLVLPDGRPIVARAG